MLFYYLFGNFTVIFQGISKQPFVR